MAAGTQNVANDANAEDGFGLHLSRASILVVDDEEGMRNFLLRTIGPRCKRLDVAANVREAEQKLDAQHYDVVILDNVMPGMNGVDWLATQRDIGFFSDAILMTAFADLETAISALRAGAVDFVLKPFRSNQILNAISRCLERRSLQRENHVLRHELMAASDHFLLRDRLIGESASIERVRQAIARVSAVPTSVLICGDSGTGKEVAARSIHELSDRADKPFVPINCAAIPADMIEAELFGHVRGAFTGANASRDGLFLHAHGGTLFLDEIGDMPLAVQAKLLRAIEERKIRPVGSEREASVDLRMIFATNVDLESKVAQGAFRADLFYRINVIRLDMPKLAERCEDIGALTELFVEKLAVQLGLPRVYPDAVALDAMQNYAWPGNVRELRNLVERSLILGAFPQTMGSGVAEAAQPSGTLDDVERNHILAILKSVDGNQSEAARRLGISRKTIERKLSVWGLT